MLHDDNEERHELNQRKDSVECLHRVRVLASNVRPYRESSEHGEEQLPLRSFGEDVNTLLDEGLILCVDSHAEQTDEHGDANLSRRTGVEDDQTAGQR